MSHTKQGYLASCYGLPSSDTCQVRAPERLSSALVCAAAPGLAMCECRGALVVAAEVFVVSTALRRGVRPAPDPEVAQLCAHLQRLRAVVSKVPDLRPLDPNLYFGPFLAVIKSDKTAGPVTGLALSAVNKFLSYGLMGESFFVCM